MEEQPEGGKKKIGLSSEVLLLLTKYPLILSILQFSTKGLNLEGSNKFIISVYLIHSAMLN